MLATRAGPQRGRHHTLTPEEHEARRRRFAALRDQVDALARTVTAEALAVFGQQFEQPYSSRNLLMILAQCPAATDVAGLVRWRERGRRVRKGEHGICILAPLPARDEQADAPDGAEAAPAHFRAAYVFDVAQTEPLASETPP